MKSETPEDFYNEGYERAIKEILERIEEITYGCNIKLGHTATCGDISFQNKIMLCGRCQSYYDKIQELKKEIEGK